MRADERGLFRIAVNERQRRGRRLQLAIRMIEQQLWQPLARLVNPFVRRRRVEKRRNICRH